MAEPCPVRLESLRLAVQLYAGQDFGVFGLVDGPLVIHAAGEFEHWLTARPSRLRLTVAPETFEQGNPSRHHPTKRTGDDMAVTMTDSQQVEYSCEAEDSRGFAVADTLTWTEDSNGAVVSAAPSADGSSCTFTAVAPGTATVTVSDGSLSGSDLVTVTSGQAASLVLTPGTPADQAS